MLIMLILSKENSCLFDWTASVIRD